MARLFIKFYRWLKDETAVESALFSLFGLGGIIFEVLILQSCWNRLFNTSMMTKLVEVFLPLFAGMIVFGVISVFVSSLINSVLRNILLIILMPLNALAEHSIRVKDPYYREIRDSVKFNKERMKEREKRKREEEAESNRLKAILQADIDRHGQEDALAAVYHYDQEGMKI